MKEQFVPYDLALKLKELGFNEKCIATFDEDENFELQDFEQNYDTFPSHIIATLLWQQAFDWFRDKYDLHSEIRSYTSGKFTFVIQKLEATVKYLHYGGINFVYSSYEEARLACLEKLITLVEEENGKT